MTRSKPSGTTEHSRPASWYHPGPSVAVASYRKVANEVLACLF